MLVVVFKDDSPILPSAHLNQLKLDLCVFPGSINKNKKQLGRTELIIESEKNV